MKTLLVLGPFVFMSFGFASPWNRANNPDIFNPIAKNKLSHSFHDLPLSGSIEDNRFGWSETYWPSNRGGIAYRWNSKNSTPFKYKLLSKEELLKLSQSELEELSPAELYDISMGDYSYTLTRKVLKKFSPDDLWWEGICHGWALAATNYAEPDKVVVTNIDGIKVPFGSSDVKGLLSMHDAYNSRGYYVRVGGRCPVRGKVAGEAYPDKDSHPLPPSEADAATDKCADVNAGAFHIVLTNMIGVNSQGFVADVDRFSDVWNQPVTSYESNVVGYIKPNDQELRAGVTQKIHVKTRMIFGEELEFYTPELEAKGSISFVSKEPVTGTIYQAFKDRKYEYVLEVDQNGKIIGGEWLSQTRPDMIWTKARDAKFLNGKFPLAGLSKIYKPILR